MVADLLTTPLFPVRALAAEVTLLLEWTERFTFELVEDDGAPVAGILLLSDLELLLRALLAADPVFAVTAFLDAPTVDHAPPSGIEVWLVVLLLLLLLFTTPVVLLLFAGFDEEEEDVVPVTEPLPVRPRRPDRRATLLFLPLAELDEDELSLAAMASRGTAYLASTLRPSMRWSL